MIRFIYDHNEIQATASGRASEITAELGVLINVSYNLIRARSPEMAENFKRGLIVSVHPDSPVWDMTVRCGSWRSGVTTVGFTGTPWTSGMQRPMCTATSWTRA